MITTASAASLSSQEKAREWRRNRPCRRVGARLLELLKSCRRGVVNALLSAEAAAAGGTGVRAPPRTVLSWGECRCKMAWKAVCDYEGPDTEPDTWKWMLQKRRPMLCQKENKPFEMSKLTFLPRWPKVEADSMLRGKKKKNRGGYLFV